MKQTVQNLLLPDRGILASDSTGGIVKRLASVGLTSSPEVNRKFRQIFFTTPNIENYIGGVILSDETVRQKTDEGINFTDLLNGKGIVPGIKVDGKRKKFKSTNQEISIGLSGLDERFKEYKKMGVGFSKWRGVVSISDLYPTDEFLEESLDIMANYAQLSQKNGIIPIVEPEVLLAGNHTNARCEQVLTKTLKTLFSKLKGKVTLEKLILKTSMVLPGRDSGVKAEPLEVANATLRALTESVPDSVFGIVFLSGGQSSEEATLNLNEIVKLSKNPPWELSFSFERALQQEAMEAWAGKKENIGKAQEVFLERLKKVSKARKGVL